VKFILFSPRVFPETNGPPRAEPFFRGRGMEPRKTPPEYFLEIFADTTTVRDVLKGASFNLDLARLRGNRRFVAMMIY
jgi:hypothetical protein